MLIDQTSFAKFIVSGEDSQKAMEFLCANNVNKPIGSTVYTQMLNHNGGIECDVTLTVIAKDTYYIITGTGFMTHDFNWITSNIPKDYKVNVKNITFDNSVFSLMGPNSRKILQGLTDTDLSNKNFLSLIHI